MALLAYRLAGEEPPAKSPRGTYRVRKGSLTESLWLQRDGSLGPRETARVFTTQNAADTAGQAAFGPNFGIF